MENNGRRVINVGSLCVGEDILAIRELVHNRKYGRVLLSNAVLSPRQGTQNKTTRPAAAHVSFFLQVCIKVVFVDEAAFDQKRALTASLELDELKQRLFVHLPAATGNRELKVLATEHDGLQTLESSSQVATAARMQRRAGANRHCCTRVWGRWHDAANS